MLVEMFKAQPRSFRRFRALNGLRTEILRGFSCFPGLSKRFVAAARNLGITAARHGEPTFPLSFYFHGSPLFEEVAVLRQISMKSISVKEQSELRLNTWHQIFRVL